MNFNDCFESIYLDLSRELPVGAGLFPHYAMSTCVSLSLFLFYSKIERKHLRGKGVVNAYINERIKPEAFYRYWKKINNMSSSFIETSQLSGVYNLTLEDVLKCEDLKKLTAGYLTIKYEGIGKEIVDNLIDKVVESVNKL